MARFLQYGGERFRLPDDFDLATIGATLFELRREALLGANSLPIIEVGLYSGGRLFIHLADQVPFAFLDEAPPREPPQH